MKNKVLMIACVLAFLMAGAPRSFASNSSNSVDPALVAADALIVRPACLVATVVGSAIFVVSLPFAVPSKSVHRAADSLVVWPAYATFKRPLGDMDSMNSY